MGPAAIFRLLGEAAYPDDLVALETEELRTMEAVQGLVAEGRPFLVTHE